MKEVLVCVAYQRTGDTLTSLDFSGDARMLDGCMPVYKTLPGWQEELRGCTRWQDLPAAAQNYVKFIEEHTGLPVKTVSVGPERDALLYRD
jgi:adenylosuccinate synthase